MRPRNSYAGDPRWIAARCDGACHRCDGPIYKGDAAFYYPSNKAMYCDHDCCARDAESDFLSCAGDEYAYSH